MSRRQRGYGTIHESDSDSDSIEVHGTDYDENSALRPHNEPAYDRARRRSFIEQDADDLEVDIPIKVVEKNAPVTWRSLPHKRQLAILVAARLSEPLVQSSLRVSKSNSITVMF